MKYLLLLILVLSLPLVEANILQDTTDFFKNYFSLTSRVISTITQTFTDESNPKLSTKEVQETSKFSNKCEDSDFQDYNLKGYCKSKLRTYHDYCSSDNQMVMEYNCKENNECSGSWYLCEGRCFDGACVETVEIEIDMSKKKII